MTARKRFPELDLRLALSCLLLFAVAIAATGVAGADSSANIESSVVKIFVRANPPDLFSPWQKAGTQAYTGSGVIIEGERILTNAHVVDDYVSLEVKRAGMTKRYAAEVTYLGHACDLALLTVSDPRFFDGAEPLPLGRPPRSQMAVDVYGFPIGGETISVTSGIISRVELSMYAHSFSELLAAQIDAAVNPGNSGGPVIEAGQIVGLAMQTLSGGDNVGYMIPAPVIRHFLEDVDDGRFDGFPRLGVAIQPLESDQQRRFLGMEDEESGGLVTRVDFGSPAWGVLQAGDVLLSADGIPIANDLTIEWPEIGRVAVAHAFRSRQIGETTSLTILRAGRRLDTTAVLSKDVKLVPRRSRRPIPTHLVFGGLVFRPLTFEYLELFDEPPADLMNHAITQNLKTPERQQIILLSQVLPNVVNRGYQDYEDLVVASVNGVLPRNLQHLAQLIDAAQGPWLSVRTEDDFILTLDIGEARNAATRILTSYGLQRDRSPDLAAASPPAMTQEGLTP